VTEQEQRILSKAMEQLGKEQLDDAIVYLDWKPVHACERLQLGDAQFNVPWDAHMVFVDLEPGVNWGHRCCYLAMRQDSDEVIRITAQMPPFLKDEASSFRLLWRGPIAPEWAVAINSD